MAILLKYEELKADFNEKLVTQLRGHSTNVEFLEAWVPDDDPVKSMLNMVEAALSFGCDDMRIRFAGETMDEAQRSALLAAVTEIAEARLVRESSSYELAIAGSKD